MDWLTGLASAVWQSFTKVVRYPVDETQRVYIPYLIASLVIAMCVYAMVGRRTEDREQVSNDCDTCHIVLAEEEEDPDILSVLNPE